MSQSSSQAGQAASRQPVQPQSSEPAAEERASTVRLNSELRHAQLELLSAHCATHQLRLHYTADQLIQFGRRDVLRKSAEAASALNDFYSAIEEKISKAAAPPAPVLATPEMIAQAVTWLADYLRGQRDHYVAAASPIDASSKSALSPYFSAGLLDRVRVLELKGARVPLPDFYTQARALGFDNLPEISHMDSVTFQDVIVFNQHLELRALFHALVHTLQIEMLGLERYAEHWIVAFLKTRAHFTVPLEVHAFSLASRFVRPNPERFSVEEQVALWVAEERYRVAP